MHRLVGMATFATVVQSGSFTAAARELGLSKSVISRQIQELEDQLGARLLNRTTRRLQLTEAGEVLYEHSRAILSQSQTAEETIGALQGRPRGLLRVNAAETGVLAGVATLLPLFFERYPEIRVELTVMGDYRDPRAEEFDLSLLWGPLDEYPNLVARSIGESRMRICATPEYWQRHGMPHEPEDLSAHNVLIYTRAPDPARLPFVGADGEVIQAPLHGNLRSNDERVLTNAALAGVGVLVAPHSMIREELEDGRLVRAMEDWHVHSEEFHLHAVYPHRRHLPPKVRVFIDFLLQQWPNQRKA